MVEEIWMKMFNHIHALPTQEETGISVLYFSSDVFFIEFISRHKGRRNPYFETILF